VVRGAVFFDVDGTDLRAVLPILDAWLDAAPTSPQ
jgi:hypothetical protein